MAVTIRFVTASKDTQPFPNLQSHESEVADLDRQRVSGMAIERASPMRSCLLGIVATIDLVKFRSGAIRPGRHKPGVL